MWSFCGGRIYLPTVPDLDVEIDNATHILGRCEWAYYSYNEAF